MIVFVFCTRNYFYLNRLESATVKISLYLFENEQRTNTRIKIRNTSHFNFLTTIFVHLFG